MKRLPMILTPVVLLAGAVTAVLVVGKLRQERTDEGLSRSVEGMRVAIERRDFDALRPVVRVTNRPVQDLWRHATKPAWVSSTWKALTKIRAIDAVRLRDPFIGSIIEDAAASGEECRGLKRFFSGAFLRWRPLARSEPDLAALPCSAEFVSLRGRPAWLIVVVWEGVFHEYVLTAHIAMFAIDPVSGEILAQKRCG